MGGKSGDWTAARWAEMLIYGMGASMPAAGDQDG
jgi:hypothetical protein